MTQLFLDSLIILLVVVDPIGLAPMFGAITHGGNREYRRRMALRGTAVATCILITFAFFGADLLKALGITMPAFQIAGGVLLFLLAVDMVFARHSGLRSTTEREQRETKHREDISVFPLAFPLIAGPGALTTVLLMSSRHAHSPGVVGIVLAVVLVVMTATLIALLSTDRIMRIMGETGANVVSRLLGVILAALAVQYMVDGIQLGFDGTA